MATWAQHYAQADLKANRAAQDIVLRERHRAFDLQAQDRTPKSDRPHFAVVGEGSRAAQDRYRHNYDRIFPLSSRRALPPSGAPRASSAVAAS